MLFNSYIFILVFLPISLLLYFAFNKLEKYDVAQYVLIVLSLVFYGYFSPIYIFVLVGSIVINYGLSNVILNGSAKVSKLITILGIIANVATIFYFKYYNFFVTTVNQLFKSKINLINVLMPLGISFFTFQQISYLVDSYRKETADYSFREYALFVSFFPQLIAGPIVLHGEMIPQFRDKEKKTFNYENANQGLYRFACGLGKKVLIADTLSGPVDWGFANIADASGLSLLIVSLMYSFQLYFDFSGYCDMAIGIAKLFNFELLDNFNSPYKAFSVSDFWKRWHMSLTRFLTRYVYIPLGGNRKGKLRTNINIMIVFLVSGLWHGANWTFVVWGILHGIASIVSRNIKRASNRLVRAIQVLVSFAFVNFAWIIFRANSLTDAFLVFKRILFSKNYGLNADICSSFVTTELTYIESHIGVLKNLTASYPFFNLIVYLAIILLLLRFEKDKDKKNSRVGIIKAVTSAILITWSLVSFNGVSKFLYFNF